MLGHWKHKDNGTTIKVVHVKTDQFQYYHTNESGDPIGAVLWNYVEILSGYKQISKA